MKKPTVQKRGDHYTYRITVANPDGTRRYIRRTFITKFEAQTDLDRTWQEVRTGAAIPPERMRFRDAAEKMMERKAGGTRRRPRPRTMERYAQDLRVNIYPVIGGITFSRVGADDVERVLVAMEGRGLSPASLVHALGLMRQVFRFGMEKGWIGRNPASAVERPNVERAQMAVLEPRHLSALMANATGTPWDVPILLAVATGARRSEVLAVRWSDIDLDRARVHIGRSLQRIPRPDGTRPLEFVPTKTSRSNRTVSLPTFAVDGLRRHRADQNARRIALGAAWAPLPPTDGGSANTTSDLVCDRGDGGPLDPDAFTGGFQRIAAGAGLPHGTRLHDVRHAVATVMLQEGVNPAVASALLGHSTVAFTLDRYGHVLEGMTSAAAQALGDALGG